MARCLALLGDQTAAVAQMVAVMRRTGPGIYIEGSGRKGSCSQTPSTCRNSRPSVRFETVSKVRGKHAFRAGQFYIVA